MTTELVFSGAPYGAPPVNLVFGVGTTGGIPDAELTLAAKLPGLGAAVHLATVVSGTLAAALPGIKAAITTLYVSGAQRPTVARVLDTAQAAANTCSGIEQHVQHAQPVNVGTQGLSQDAQKTGTTNTLPFTDAQRFVNRLVNTFTEGQRHRVGMYGRMQEGDPSLRVDLTGKMQDAIKPAKWWTAARFQDGIRTSGPRAHTKFQEALRSGRHSGHKGNYATPVARDWYGPFQEAWPARAGTSPRPAKPPVVPNYWGTDLLFACPPLAFPNLVFGVQQCDLPSDPATFQILPARFYMTTHNIFAQRVPDNLDVPIFDATVAADSGSYCWSLSASGPASLFELLAPVGGLPAQLRITLDGLPFLFAIDSISRTHQFGQRGVRITGRSVTSLIAAPYLRATTHTNDTDQLAQQLATDALQYSGVTLDWGLTDWLIPAGAWSYQGTPLEAVQTIVQAAGGYLQSQRNAATLQARHPYSQRTGDNPGAPWGWMSGPADVELATDALITESVTRKDGPDINGVYVSGTGAGVLALVKRTGTAADKLAAMATDPLITHVDAARQRGLSILGAAGSKYDVAIELPVLTGAGQPGILNVGQLVQVNATEPWRGRVRAVSVAAKAPSLRQTVTLERHLETI